MDRKERSADRYAWLPDAMPGVARLMRERRRQLGDQHVNECWRRGMGGEPGWFFAREGAIAIGTPWGDGEMLAFAARHVTSTQALLVLREPQADSPEQAGHGA